MITIKVKNEGFNGERAGVGFVNGIANVPEITPEQKKFFKEMGYTVTGKPEKKTDAKNDKKEGNQEEKTDE